MEALLGLAGYSFVAAVTPGPNNVVLWGIGLRFGYRAAIPYLLGIPLGVGLMILSAAAGLGALINAVPALGIGLKMVGPTCCISPGRLPASLPSRRPMSPRLPGSASRSPSSS